MLLLIVDSNYSIVFLIIAGWAPLIRKTSEELLSTMISNIVMSEKWPLFPKGSRHRLLILVAKRRLTSGIKQSYEWAQFQRQLRRLAGIADSRIIESDDLIPKAERHRSNNPSDDEAHKETAQED